MRGKMLSYGAVIRSGQASAEQLGIALDKLLGLASKRSYLSLPAYTFIVEAFNQVPIFSRNPKPPSTFFKATTNDSFATLNHIKPSLTRLSLEPRSS